ncbi:MAG: hypothetical protein COB04_05200 [Gammaproteobacteria bacterium]|nr:MAG: hypothetical protein COB04_06870 [Gammaproteobacteria bacterium]PCJ19706.1 MAG: hypothetical protein COB04_05200 [Gammaproteobacteria bacterium]
MYKKVVYLLNKIQALSTGVPSKRTSTQCSVIVIIHTAPINAIKPQTFIALQLKKIEKNLKYPAQTI